MQKRYSWSLGPSCITSTLPSILCQPCTFIYVCSIIVYPVVTLLRAEIGQGMYWQSLDRTHCLLCQLRPCLQTSLHTSLHKSFLQRLLRTIFILLPWRHFFWLFFCLVFSFYVIYFVFNYHGNQTP